MSNALEHAINSFLISGNAYWTEAQGTPVHWSHTEEQAHKALLEILKRLVFDPKRTHMTVVFFATGDHANIPEYVLLKMLVFMHAGLKSVHAYFVDPLYGDDKEMFAHLVNQFQTSSVEFTFELSPDPSVVKDVLVDVVAAFNFSMDLALPFHDAPLLTASILRHMSVQKGLYTFASSNMRTPCFFSSCGDVSRDTMREWFDRYMMLELIVDVVLGVYNSRSCDQNDEKTLADIYNSRSCHHAETMAEVTKRLSPENVKAMWMVVLSMRQCADADRMIADATTRLGEVFV